MKALRWFRTLLVVTLFLAAASARAQVYVTLGDVFGLAPQVFGTVNLGTGVFTQISNPSVLFTSLSAGPGDVLYGSDLNSNFFTITASGSISAIGPAGSASGIRGLSYSGSDFRAVQLSGGAINLLSFPPDLSSGAFVGQMAATFGNLSGGSLTYGPLGNLYFAFNPTPGNPPPAYLYTVNPANGAITQVGNVGLGANPLVLASDGTTLYGFSTSTDRTIYTIDTTLGTATAIGSITNVPSNSYAVGTAAFAIPEPGAIALLCLGGLVLVTRRRFRK